MSESSTSIQVNKQSVQELLKGGAKRHFIIPEYQRPYAWGIDEIDTLVDDLWDFTVNGDGGYDGDGTYFLGSIVSFQNEEDETGETSTVQEIIDGQQRITSLFLLLRAIYTKLDSVLEKTDEAKKLISEIEPAIWHIDNRKGNVYYDHTLLTSRVLNNEGNQILHNILKTGQANPEARDNYSRNYLHFQERIDALCKADPLRFHDFVYAVLHQAVLLPVTANDQETALTIFSTLNDRGLPLSDADIFKAELYKHQDASEKPGFIERWQELEDRSAHAWETVRQLFTYYMLYLRALEGNSNSTLPGLRKYYFGDKDKRPDRLYRPGLMDDLFRMAGFWGVVRRHDSIPEEPWSQNIRILQALDILSDYPNEYWKYPTLIYYLTHGRESQFTVTFERFLYRLLRELLIKYLLTPTVNAVKSDIMRLDVDILSSQVPVFFFKSADVDRLPSAIKTPHRRAVRMLLKILAYQKQDTLLPEVWEIEHIFPQKWQASYILNLPDEEIQKKINYIGNLLPLEKKLNIQASNGYFGKKKKEYQASAIRITQEMVNLSEDWTLDDIVERNAHIVDELLALFQQWNDDYQHALTVSAP